MNGPYRQPWLTARRGDIIELIGAALVVLLLLAVLLVAVVRDGKSDAPASEVPYLPFAGTAPSEVAP